MDIEEYKKLESQINAEYILKLHNLRNDYINSKKKYNIGDYVFNVTGIIRVESVSYDLFWGSIEIIYSGYRYKKIKGVLSRTRDNKITSMRESHNLKLI